MRAPEPLTPAEAHTTEALRLIDLARGARQNEGLVDALAGLTHAVLATVAPQEVTETRRLLEDVERHLSAELMFSGPEGRSRGPAVTLRRRVRAVLGRP